MPKCWNRESPIAFNSQYDAIHGSESEWFSPAHRFDSNSNRSKGQDIQTKPDIHFKRIITHSDFDGVVSAAICSFALNIDYIIFTGPRNISDARLSVTEEDVVCDLPCPMQVGLWFDHHEGNLEELEYRNIDTESIPGRFSPDLSCARVVYDYFSEHMELPSHFSEMVREADDIDSFNFSSIDEWRRETPGKIIDGTLRLQHEKPDIKWQFMRQLVGHLKERPLPEVAKLPSIKKRYRFFQEEESRILQQIKDNSTFLEQDPDQQMVVIDLTPHKKRQFVIKNLAYILYPKALAVIEVKNLFQNNIKTNNLSFSLSLSIELNNRDHNKDVGLIMRELNIGGGHKGAAAGTIHCDTKDDMIRQKHALLNNIFDLFKTQ